MFFDIQCFFCFFKNFFSFKNCSHLEQPEERMLSHLRREDLVSHGQPGPDHQLVLHVECQHSPDSDSSCTLTDVKCRAAFSGMPTVCIAVVAGSNYRELGNS